MWTARAEPGWSVDAWREQARRALVAGIAPELLHWDGDIQAGLVQGSPLPELVAAPPRLAVPAALLELAGSVVCHRDAGRHALLYRLLWRVCHGERRLLERATDADVVTATTLAQAVRRDSHKMKAFVRFRQAAAGDAYVAWFEPEHWILDRVAPFFARRFAGMRWAILTPYRSVRWDGRQLDYGPGAVRADAPADDAQEDLWRTYYANIFNPARLNPTMMRQEMPQKYWKGLPEAELLPTLLRDAGRRTHDMVQREPQAPRRRIPVRPPGEAVPRGDWGAMRAAAMACERCELFRPATQTVWGEGPLDARVMLVGEQPGDAEDLTGRPFVGPAGKLLDRALAELGIDRQRLYLTNAVKHFRFQQRGKLRLHKRPDAGHARACRVWLEQELALVRPRRVVCLGATAAAAVFGPSFRLLESRGQWQDLGNGARGMATVHPSWVLRQPAGERDAAYRGLVADLRGLLTAEREAGTG